MSAPEEFVDYYKVLQCARTAPGEDLKRCYQRLVRLKHPDKKDVDIFLNPDSLIDPKGEQDEAFLLVQKAWTVLRDPESRRLYDATLACHEHSSFLLYDTINLRDMEQEDDTYYFDCRCGGEYVLENHQMITPKVVVGCSDCTLSILINTAPP